MTGRNDSALWTGANSQTFSSKRERKAKERRQVSKEEREDVQAKLFPAAEVIFEMLDYEVNLVTAAIAKMPITASTTNENVKELLMVYQHDLKRIERLRGKFKKALKQPRLTPEQIDEALNDLEDDNAT